MLKLIKTAQIITSTSKHDLEVLGVLSQATGKPLHELTESYAWTPEDYEQMLDLIKAYGEEEGLNINKRAVFSEIAGAALENDSKSPLDPKMQGAVISKLWNDFKAGKQLAKINKLGQAAEEEEALKANLRRLTQGHEEEEIGYDKHRGPQSTTSQLDCPTCHSRNIKTFSDGGHECNTCGTSFGVSGVNFGVKDYDQEEEEYGAGARSPNYQDNKTGSQITGAERFGTFAGHVNKHAGANDVFTYGSGSENEESADFNVYYDYAGAGRGPEPIAGPFHSEAEAEFWRSENCPEGDNNYFVGGAGIADEIGSEDEEQGPRHQDVRKLNPTLDRQLFTKNDAETIANRGRLHAAQENEEKSKKAAEHNNSVWGKHVSGTPAETAHRAATPGGYATRREYLSAIKRANKHNNRHEENEEGSTMATKPDTETAEKKPRTPQDIAHQILTAPRELMRDATKSIKDEGGKAWADHELPKNPHPIKSAAHKHWLDGMRKAAIAALGLEPKPTDAGKPKKR